MKNGEKYKTAKDRADAFWRDYIGPNAPYDVVEAFADWLDLEAEAEEPLPCPFCGGEIIKTTCGTQHCYGFAYCEKCGYRTMKCHNHDAAIAAHNRVARAAKEKEANDANA